MKNVKVNYEQANISENISDSTVISNQITTENSNEEEENKSRIITSSGYEIDVKNQRFPFCIVWTPLPCISFFIPFIGHTGICE